MQLQTGCVAWRSCRSSQIHMRATVFSQAVYHHSRYSSSARSFTTTASPNPAAFRSLYRALLRESTYLPDRVARVYFKQYIVTRFRRYNSRRSTNSRIISLASTQDQYQQIPSPSRLVNLWRAGLKGLHRLQRANQGHRQDLLAVLLSTYGRKGARRHELLEPLKSFDREHATRDSGQVASEYSSVFCHLPQHLVKHLPRLSPAHKALLDSQRKANLRFSTRPRINRVALDIPKANIWLRPIPVKRVANIVRRWYGEKLSQSLPPLPRSEWDWLQGLASGKRKWEGPIPRRIRATDIASSASNHLGHSTVLYQALGLSSTPKSGGKDQAHTLTRRYMRRVYCYVFRMCPYMDWDSATQSWNIQWGSASASQHV